MAPDERLVELIARVFVVREELLALSDAEASAMPATRLRHLERVARLSYLDPSIITAILDGSHGKEVRGELVVAGSDAAEVLQLGDSMRLLSR